MDHSVSCARLYVLHVGGFRLPRNSVAPGALNGAEPVYMPIYCYLIQHPTHGNILVDTGQGYDRPTPAGVGGPEDSVVAKLGELGLTPDDIDYVILSHMHLDHAGEMSRFPRSTFVVRREELRAAWWPEKCEGGYVYDQYKDTRDYTYIQVPDNVDYDLFMDGSVILVDTHGHSRGHQSVAVRLRNTGRALLICDAASLRENLERSLLPGVCTDNWRALESLEKIRRYERGGYRLFFMHDPDVEYRLSPRYYD